MIPDLPVIGWLVYWYTHESDYGHPMSTYPIFLLTDQPGEWMGEWDTGCATNPPELNLGRAWDDRYDWRVRVVPPKAELF